MGCFEDLMEFREELDRLKKERVRLPSDNAKDSAEIDKESDQNAITD